jgi:hypothetical protein
VRPRQVKRTPGPKKKLSRQAILGQQGINLIEGVVLSMGSRWSVGGANEVGIDGYVELFDPATGEALGRTLGVQSKAVSTFDNETRNGFTFRCDPRDVEYWTQGNLPVILIVSKPSTREAYWISVKDYFSTVKSGSTVHFAKAATRFTAESFRNLLSLGADPAQGLYLGPAPRPETLSSNLLEVATFPPKLYIAATDYRSIPEVRKRLKPGVGGVWIVHEKSLVGFENFSGAEWASVCDTGSTDDFDTAEWAESDDRSRLNVFVDLLNRALRRQVGPEVRYWADEECYAFEGHDTVKVRYRSVKRQSTITVVSKYSFIAATGDKIDRLRHLAFRGRFRRFEGRWYLQITPTYRFTNDGAILDRYHADKLSGIKRIEGNRAVLSALLFWTDYLTANVGLFSRRTRALQFNRTTTFELPVGINDQNWSARDPSPPPGRLADGQEMLLPFA